jgi:adenosylcobinamide kinase/adenosylcobinamide-phosphate guanylyltransferase
MNIIYISGGQRSGKSEYAEKLALARAERPVYIATSRIWDRAHEERVSLHQQRRTQDWQTVEEEKWISHIRLNGNTALLDCLTLWLTNFFEDHQYDASAALAAAQQEWDRFIQQDGSLIVVSNELGMGLHPIEKGARDFVDIHGKLNQYIATVAHEAFFMVSGLPLKVR